MATKINLVHYLHQQRFQFSQDIQKSRSRKSAICILFSRPIRNLMSSTSKDMIENTEFLILLFFIIIERFSDYTLS